MKQKMHNAIPAEWRRRAIAQSQIERDRLATRRGDYSCNNLNCGDRVFDKADPRHLGTLRSIECGLGEVRWDGTGWISFVSVHNLVFIKGEKR